ncbi:FAD-dependent monooxygenase [Actinomadura sp. DC4]|uniref:FAD-dependent monooxygenase n=1 Tax=Actinomadura sp. DC4 TaxID=3055069 RepID=UPI0025B22D8D|nr:FAD-dependent monooxygenase [Actinomadura sp. DC4]MDN3359000.1 FAD-dependent monooxygenase [Actinomadura sp. DC4]
MNCTVVISGGGPAGLMLASELGMAGVDTVVLEKEHDRETGSNLRSTMLHARAVDLLERRGLMERIGRDAFVKWPLIHFANFWLDLQPLLEHEYSLIVPQTHTVSVLEERAREVGADIRRGHELTGVTQDEDGVTVHVRSGGEEYRIDARYLVGCDGEDSAVRRLAGFEAPQSGITWYGVLADYENASAEPASPTYPGGLFARTPHPYKQGWVRTMTMELGVDAPGPEVPVTVEELRTAAERITGEKQELGPPTWAYRYTNRTRLAARYRDGRVFLAGDAAHVHYFAAGHGVSTGLHDAVNLGWKLAAEVRGQAPAGLLDTYQTERHAVGRRACVSAEAQLALLHPPERVAPLRELFEELVRFPDVNRHLVGVITDVRYPFEHTGATAHPLLGAPVPDAPLKTADGETTLAATLRNGRGVVLDLRDGSGGISRWEDRVDLVAATPVAGLDAARLLVRPDGHVAWVDADGTDDEGLRTALTTWFGAPADEQEAL